MNSYLTEATEQRPGWQKETLVKTKKLETQRDGGLAGEGRTLGGGAAQGGRRHCGGGEGETQVVDQDHPVSA